MMSSLNSPRKYSSIFTCKMHVCVQQTDIGNRWLLEITVEPPNKGHFGDNINSAVLSFVERLSSSRRFKMY